MVKNWGNRVFILLIMVSYFRNDSLLKIIIRILVCGYEESLNKMMICCPPDLVTERSQVIDLCLMTCVLPAS